MLPPRARRVTIAGEGQLISRLTILNQVDADELKNRLSYT
jgi:hypothetical protein